MARKINRAGLELVKEFEGLRLEAYPDPGSVDGNPWTIGYGSTAGVKKGMKITKELAEARLVDDLAEAERAVAELIEVPLNDNQFAALTSFTFNLGRGNLQKSTLRTRLNAGDYEAIPAQLARWNKNDGKVMAGLTRRRAAEAELWRTPSQTTKPIILEPLATETSPVRSGVLTVVVIAAVLIAVVAYLIINGAK